MLKKFKISCTGIFCSKTVTIENLASKSTSLVENLIINIGKDLLLILIKKSDYQNHLCGQIHHEIVRNLNR